MNTNDAITSLQSQVHAARDEFDFLIACHEAWKPAAYDSALHKRVSHSYAGQTFLVVRSVLRREVLLGLTRLWDDDDRRALRMRFIADCLSRPAVIQKLADKCAAQWGHIHDLDLSEIPESERAEVIEAAKRSEVAFGRQMAEELRKRAEIAVDIIRKYDQGGSCHSTLKKLRNLRNERLAHRQVKPTPVEVRGADATDEEIESFYRDMSELIKLLLSVVLRTSYNTADTAGVFQHYAKFFWASVRGERTEGHPTYRPPRAPFNPGATEQRSAE